MFKRFLRNRRGSVLPIFAIAAIPLIVSTGAVVDYSRAFDQRTVVQDAMDAAALAAGKEIGLISDSLVQAEADTFFVTNIGNKVTTMPTLASAIAASTITLTTTLKVPTYVLGMIGLNEFSFDLIAKATLAAGMLEVAMVLDNSGSMSGTKIATLLTAAADLTDTLYALGATSTATDPVKVGLVPFASSVKVDPANKTAAWMDTTGVAPYNAESFEGFTGSPPVSNDTPSGKNVLGMFDTLSGTDSSWAGCLEERQAPYDVQDDAASTGTPATMFVPMFAPDEPDNWTCTTSTCNKTCDSGSCTSSSAGLRYNGAPSGSKNYNNYLPDAGAAGTCGPAVTVTSANPAVFTSTAHGLTAGNEIVFQTTGSLYTGLTAGTPYKVFAAGLTADSFELQKTSTVTMTIAHPAVFTSSSHGLAAGDQVSFTTTGSLPTGLTAGTQYTVFTAGLTANAFELQAASAVIIPLANPALLASVNHGLVVGDPVSFTTTGSLPTGLTAGTTYYVKQVPATGTFTLSATSANTTATISLTSPGVITTSAAHGLVAGKPIVFRTTGALPTGLTAGTTYYVKTVTSTTKFTVSLTNGGIAINTSGSQSGTQSFAKLVATTSLGSGTHTLARALNTTGSQSGTHTLVRALSTSGSQSGTHSYTKTADWTCANGTAGCGTGGVGQSEQTALLGQNIATQNLCKYGTTASKAAISSITVSLSGGGSYPGGPNFNCTTTAVTPLTATKATVTTAISAMAAKGTTNITAGLMWGWRALSPTAPFTEGRAYGAANNQKILILMTDGENTYFANGKFPVSYYGAWGYIWKSHLGTTSSSTSTMQGKMEERMALACAKIKAAGIKVYTVAFEITDAATLQLLSDCADDTSMAFNAASPAALTAAFTAIGEDISLLRLAQ